MVINWAKNNTRRWSTIHAKLKERLALLEKQVKEFEETTLKQKRERKLLIFVLLSCLLALFSSALLTYLNIIDLKLMQSSPDVTQFEFIGSALLFMINMFFVTSISLGVYDRKIGLILVGYVPIYIIVGYFFGTTLITTFYVPIVYCIMVAKVLRRTYTVVLLNLFLYTLIIGSYQLLATYVKFNVLKLDVFQFPNVLYLFMYSIDSIIFNVIIYKVVKQYEQVAREIFIRSIRIFKTHCKKILVFEKEDLSDLTKRQQVAFKTMVYIYMVIQPVVIIGSNVLLNRFFASIDARYIGTAELLSSWVVLEGSRIILGKTFHSPNPIVCNKISFIVFFMLSRFALPLNISLFFNLCLAAYFAFLINQYTIKKEQVEDMENYLKDNNE